ncbi:MAG: ATP-binding cassette domain-containing protein [Chitinophagaceae bacterium]|nr:ATP-binding cassette domain-containing protein [Chitinophagaceae bacterium]
MRKGPLARILDLLKLEKNEISAIYFYSILNGVIQLSLPVGVQSIISFVLGASMTASLIILITLVVIGVLVTGLLQVNQMKIIEKIQQKLYVRYALAFAYHIPELDLKKNDSVYLPELVNRYFDITLLQKGLSKVLLEVPTAAIQIFFGLLLLAFYHPAFIAFGVLLISTVYLILKYTGGKGLQTSLEKSRQKYRVAAWLEEMARIIKTLKQVKKYNLHIQKADETICDYLKARNNHFRILLLQYNTLVVFKTVVTAAMLIVGTVLMLRQQLTVGQFIASEIVIILVLNSVEKIIINLAGVYDTLTAVEKVSELIDKPAEKSGTILMNKYGKALSVKLNHVSFGYNEDKKILKDITLNIQPGERVLVKGEVSAGKSTLLRLMSGAYTEFDGTLLIDDLPVQNYRLDSLRSHIGLMINELDIFQGTILENLTLGNEAVSIEHLKELVKKTGLEEFISRLPNGYDTDLDPTGKRLPRNIVQRILLVRALAHNPGLLLLEDPWTFLTASQKKQMTELLSQLKDTTIIVATNDDGELSFYNKIVILNEDGTLKQ